MKQESKIAILATMSSGKSTFLNALIGKEILPAENQSCTGNIFEISNKQRNLDKLRIFYKEKLIEKKKLKDYNLKAFNKTDENIRLKIDTNFFNIEKKIIFFDTPGVNSFENKIHSDITYNFLENEKIKNYIFLLNVTQIGTKDEADFLRELKKVLEKTEGKVLFVLNKIDCLDELTESAKDLEDRTKEYLKRLGFNEPLLISVSAYKAMILRKRLNQEIFTRKEKFEYLAMLEKYNYRDNYKENLNKKEKKIINKLLKDTGIIAIENLFK